MEFTAISGHGCIRMHKMNLALMMRGHRIHLVTSKLTNFFEQYKTFNLCNDIEQIIESLKMAVPSSDFLHAHNEPSYYVSIWKELTDKPVILDVHDSFLARMTPEQAAKLEEEGKIPFRIRVEERNNFQMADALIFPSESFADLICNEFKLTQPRLILPSYVPKQFYSYDPREWMGGICYEGKTELNDGPQQFQYCNYVPFSDACRDLGIDFHLYSGRDPKEGKFKKQYYPAFRHEPMSFGKLIKNIGRHDWGLVGNVTEHPEWDIAMPNKLFEYMAAGVPIVAMNASESGKFVEEHKIGISVSSLKDLTERWGEHVECRKNVFKLRDQFCMDRQIKKLEGFYSHVMERFNNSILTAPSGYWAPPNGTIKDVENLV